MKPRWLVSISVFKDLENNIDKLQEDNKQKMYSLNRHFDEIKNRCFQKRANYYLYTQGTK